MEQGPEGMVLFHLWGVFAEYEHAKLMERTHRGRVKRAQRGSPWGGEVKLGYRAIREQHQASWVIEEEAAFVRRIFQMALTSLSQ
jgi:DNA invertase Pin-like site-specific DNA recombinase